MDSALIEQAFKKLYSYLKKENFKGWDPYDGLNSPFIQKTFLKNKYSTRLVFIQLFKKNPVNLRKLFFVKKDYNPKGLGLFITSFCNLYKIERREEYLKYINLLADNVLNLKSAGFSGDCWGYNFDWQARDFFFPKYSPTVVATSFIANALLDAFEMTKEQKFLDSAISSGVFVRKDLKRTKKGEGFLFSYSPYDNRQVYNASLLASKLLARIFYYTKDQDLYEDAYNSVKACINAQNGDGSWYYGEPDMQKWIDSFHTGYNLECINDFQKFTGNREFSENIDGGFNYYINNFFMEDGTPKYYHNKIYPVDIHSPAQLTAVLFKLDRLDEYKSLVDKVLEWTIKNMFDEGKGYFYYQANPYYKVKIPYIRWSQAWMFYALSYYLLYKGKSGKSAG